MIPVFLTLWSLYMLHSVYLNLCSESKHTTGAQLMQGGLVLLALWWAARTGVFSRFLWSPVDIIAGVLLGHVLFAVALLITHQHLGDVGRHLMDLRGLCRFMKAVPDLVLRFAGVSVVEELVYRVAAQSMLLVAWDRPVPAILITAVFFCVTHDHFFRRGWIGAVEFMLFTLLIGILYYYTASLTLVVLVHLIRNLESAYIEFQLLQEECNDTEEALRILHKSQASVVMESL